MDHKKLLGRLQIRFHTLSLAAATLTPAKLQHQPKRSNKPSTFKAAFVLRIRKPRQSSRKAFEYMLRNFGFEIGLCLTLVLLTGCSVRGARSGQSTSAQAATSVPYLQRSTQGVARLQQWYTPSSGLYQTTGWWNSANALTVLADYARTSGSDQYSSTFANTFTQAQKTNPAFLNKFYDDEGWWALAWIDVYDITRNPQYLMAAEAIFADMANGWDDTCGGGIWWSKDRKYKNAIANELFLSVAAHLANRTSGSARSGYSRWANREWKWFRATGMINSKNLINDGLDISPEPTPPGHCSNNGQTTWTYNQGVILGGLAELSVTNHDPALRQAAHNIATAATTLLVDSNGVLHDPCEPKCGPDAVQFKGIFVRNLGSFAERYPRSSYSAFIAANADAVWNYAQGPDAAFAETWSGPFQSADAGTQSSALDAIIAAAALHSSKQKQ